MSARAIASGTLTFGLVSVPFKIYTAASSHQTSFNLLHQKCGGRMKQQYLCPVDSEIVERADMVKGFEFGKDTYVTFTEEELKALQSEKTDSLEVVEFVPEVEVDPLAVEKSFFLGPDKGGERGYQLLGRVMDEMAVVAVGRYWTRGKVQLVFIRPYQGGLVMHYAFYADEVRSFEGIAPEAEPEFKDIELEMARSFVSSLTNPDFRPGKYHDEYEDRVKAAVEMKIAGKAVNILPEAPTPAITDLFEALKRSLPSSMVGKPAPEPRRPRGDGKGGKGKKK